MSDFNFNHPNRQSYAAIVLIIYKFYKTLLRQLWPFILIFFFGGRFSEKKEWIYGIAAVAFLSTIYGIISFFKYYFYIQDNQLNVEKGVLRKTKTNIPLERIQSIDFEQNLIHQLFNVVKVKIDTAGSSEEELNLQALNKNQAIAFRDAILKERKIQIEDLKDVGTVNTLQEETKPETILKIDIVQLLKVGISANHLKSAWIIVFFLFWVYENLNDIGIDLVDRYEDQIEASSVLLQNFFIIGFFVLAILIISFIISLVRTVLQFFELKFIREKNKFKVTSGLFNRRETAALDNKVQIVSWSQNILQKSLSLFELSLRQASSAEVKVRKNIFVPGIQAHQIEGVNDYLFEQKDRHFNQHLKTESIYFYRYAMYMSLVFLPLIACLYYFNAFQASLIISAIYGYQLIGLYLRSKKYAIAYNKDSLVHRTGTWGITSSLIALHKIQSVVKRRGIYQRRNGYADIIIITAGGSLSIPYLNEQAANNLINHCLYKVESSEEKWM